MTPKDTGWSNEWSVGVRVWVERSGHAILGKGRLELLEGIDRWRSISGAARQMGMSYRHAWLLVQSINEAAGEPLVTAATGGMRGGGAQLTERGRLAVQVFRDLQSQVQRTAANALARMVTRAAVVVHVAAAVSLEGVLGQLLADYALQQPAVVVRTVHGGSDELADLILAGAPTDLFLAADETQLDRLAAAGIINVASRVILAENRLAAIGPADRDLPVRRPRDLLRPEVKHIALAAVSCPLGGYTRDYLETLGLYAALSPRAVHVDNSRAVVASVQGGQVDAGIVYASDAASSGHRILFRASATQAPIHYAAAVIEGGQQAGRAKALLDFLTSAVAARRFRSSGFIPVRIRSGKQEKD